MKRILFQGDSITDGNRTRDEGMLNIYPGSAYPFLVSAELGYKYPNQYTFMNRGVAGNRVVDMLTRVRKDVINLKPDFVSILIGANDVWQEFLCQNGFSKESFERIYNVFLTEIKESLPDVKFIILEPFVLKGEGTMENWDEFRQEIEKRAAVSKKLAAKYDADFIPLQKKFDEAFLTAPMGYWLVDGVHPSPAGHKIIADAWLENFKKYA